MWIRASLSVAECCPLDHPAPLLIGFGGDIMTHFGVTFLLTKSAARTKILPEVPAAFLCPAILLPCPCFPQHAWCLVCCSSKTLGSPKAAKSDATTGQLQQWQRAAVRGRRRPILGFRGGQLSNCCHYDRSPVGRAIGATRMDRAARR